jgi:hypothetical protein
MVEFLTWQGKVSSRYVVTDRCRHRCIGDKQCIQRWRLGYNRRWSNVIPSLSEGLRVRKLPARDKLCEALMARVLQNGQGQKTRAQARWRQFPLRRPLADPARQCCSFALFQVLLNHQVYFRILGWKTPRLPPLGVYGQPPDSKIRYRSAPREGIESQSFPLPLATNHIRGCKREYSLGSPSRLGKKTLTPGVGWSFTLFSTIMATTLPCI